MKKILLKILLSAAAVLWIGRAISRKKPSPIHPVVDLIKRTRELKTNAKNFRWLIEHLESGSIYNSVGGTEDAKTRMFIDEFKRARRGDSGWRKLWDLKEATPEEQQEYFDSLEGNFINDLWHPLE